MSDFIFLLPISLVLGLLALGAFFWSLASEQYDDIDGAAERILHSEDNPIVEELQDQSKSVRDEAP